jgi:hypothetical protein
MAPKRLRDAPEGGLEASLQICKDALFAWWIKHHPGNLQNPSFSAEELEQALRETGSKVGKVDGFAAALVPAGCKQVPHQSLSQTNTQPSAPAPPPPSPAALMHT